MGKHHCDSDSSSSSSRQKHRCKKNCDKKKKVDPLVGAWNGATLDGLTNVIVAFNADGTYVVQSGNDIGPLITPTSPNGLRITISTGNWKNVGCNKYETVDSNIVVQQGATFNAPGTSILRVKKTGTVTLSKVGGEYQLDAYVVFTIHALTDLQCVTPLPIPPPPPATATYRKLLF